MPQTVHSVRERTVLSLTECTVWGLYPLLTQVPAKGATNKSNSTRFKLLYMKCFISHVIFLLFTKNTQSNRNHYCHKPWMRLPCSPCPQAFISLAILIIKVMQWCWYNPFWNKRTWICKCLDNRSWNPVCQMWHFTKPACNVW